ncbi:MAG: homoserine O-acetyltransferase [Verrucomicrobiota bacterium]
MKTEIQTLEITGSGETLELRQGALTGPVTLAYETYGELNASKSNAVLLFHALSGTPHAAGLCTENPYADGRWTEEIHLGWWDDFIGSGKALDTDEYFVICINYLGGCYGSTGPADINPATGRHYGSEFPRVMAEDQVMAQAKVLDHYGIDCCHAVVGASVGALLAVSFATQFPERTKLVVPIAGGFTTTVLNRLLLFEQILAIENDPKFMKGDYYESGDPTYGLALARMISHKTFIHLDAIERRANRMVKQQADHFAWFKIRDSVQSYMIYQGKKFVDRFDANTYLRICDMWSSYDPVVGAGVGSIEDLFTPSKDHGHHYLIFSIDSDFCFYPEEQAELVKHLKSVDVETIYITVHSEKGHDSFLLEPELFTPHIDHFLKSVPH